MKKVGVDPGLEVNRDYNISRNKFNYSSSIE